MPNSLTVLEKEMKPYVDRFGLVTPSGGTSGNGLLYTSEWLLTLFRQGILDDETTQKYSEAIDKCQVTKGLFNRHPEATTHRNATDDYIGVIAVSRALGLPYAHFIYRHGVKYAWVFNNVNPGFFHISSWFGRKFQFRAHVKFGIGMKPNLFERLVWCYSVITSAWKPLTDQDARTLTWLLVITASGQDDLTDKVGEWWMSKFKSQYKNGMSTVLEDYFGFQHPIARYIK